MTFLVAFGVLLLGFVVGCGPSSESSEGEPLPKLTLQTNWAPQPEDGGFFQAAATGAYRDAGLDVTVRPATAGSNIYALVAGGEAEVGISVATKLIVAIDKGLPLVAVAAYRPASLRVLLVHENDPVRNFSDLDGRTLKARGEDLWLKYLQDEYKLSLRVIPHDFGLGQFVAMPDLVQQGLLTSEPFSLRSKGVPVRVLMLSDAGWENMELLFVRRSLLEEHPEQVRKVAQASLEGWRTFLTGDPEPGLAYIAQENPARSEEAIRWARDELATLYAQSHAFDGPQPFGVINREKLQGLIDLLVRLKAIDQPIPVERVADFSIIEGR